jgi:ribonuclease HII
MMGYMITVGIDEVGRGCWAGPLVAGAVLLPDDFMYPPGASWRLDDSKVLSKSQRQTAAEAIESLSVPKGIGWVSAQEVDALGLTGAVRLAMQRALNALELHGVAYDEAIIDGSYNFLPEISTARAVIKADGSVPAVSAASIIAKVARDNWMAEVAAVQFPGYGFERHVGYGTLVHREALVRLGLCELHRRSFKPIQALANSVGTN